MGQDPQPTPSSVSGGSRAPTSYQPKLKTSEAAADYPPVRECMDKTFITLKADDNVYHAIETLLDKKISGAGVVDDDGRLCGILTEKDLLRVLTHAAYDGLPAAKVGDYMTCDVNCVSSDTDILKAVRIFLDNPYRRLMVVDDGKLVGQITRRDILRAMRRFLKSQKNNTFT